MRTLSIAVTLALLAVFTPVNAWAQEEGPVRVLLLTKSSGYEHSCIREEDGKPGHVQSVVQKLADTNGAILHATKDASVVNAEDLEKFDLVVLITSGDLTTKGTDGEPPMGKNGLKDLLGWIEAGGGLMGYHCASDTFGHHMGDPDFPFIKMIGAQFREHGEQFTGTLRLVDPDHPAMASLVDGFSIRDEWYMFKDMNKDNIHVLALLDPGDEREKQEEYDVPNYPIIWCREYGEGRVYYNAMGHREDVWDNEYFQASFVDAAEWTLGETPAQAKPNYKDVVPSNDKK